MTYRNFKYGAKRNKFLLSLVWIPIVLIAFPMIEQNYHAQMVKYGTVLYAISFGFGIYYTYVITMWIDSRLSRGDFHIWLKRIVSGLMVVFSIFLLTGVMLSSAVAATTRFYEIMGISYFSFMSLMAGISIGLLVFSSYLTFRYMRQSGYIVYTR